MKSLRIFLVRRFGTLRRVAGALAVVSLLTVSASCDPGSPKLTKARYEQQVDQQLQDLSARIRGQRRRARTLKGSARDHLSENVRMLEAKLQAARRLREQVARTGSEWLHQKKALDAQIVHLRKSLTYVANAQL